MPQSDTNATTAETKGWTVWIAAAIGILAIGGVDYFSGVELRVFPLYFAPIALIAWHRGRLATLIAAVLCAASWLSSNALAGMQFSRPALWAGNAAMQTAAFAIVGLLISHLREGLIRERGLSRTDPLTLLLNSRAFYEEAARAVAVCRRKRRPLTLAYVDVDDFKVVNDTLGHRGGDDLLRRLAGSLRACTRPGDLCARLGGDEFAVLLPEVEPREAAAVLERLQALLSETAVVDTCRATASVGAVTFVAVPDDVEGMVSAADVQLYAAKRAGKNRLCLEVVVDDAASSARGDQEHAREASWLAKRR